MSTTTTTTTTEYLNNMYNAIGTKLIDPDSMYYGREGHLRLAREMGFALSDFTEKEQQEILHSSYGSIYVRCCNLKPILDAKEWIREMTKENEAEMMFKAMQKNMKTT